jgi:hypothetical protein
LFAIAQQINAEFDWAAFVGNERKRKAWTESMVHRFK